MTGRVTKEEPSTGTVVDVKDVKMQKIISEIVKNKSGVGQTRSQWGVVRDKLQAWKDYECRCRGLFRSIHVNKGV